jgi:hypothetical protein
MSRWKPSLAVGVFLDHWLTGHLTSSDQRIGEFLRGRDSEATAVAPEAVGMGVSR